jgi:hypothetical protein
MRRTRDAQLPLAVAAGVLLLGVTTAGVAAVRTHDASPPVRKPAAVTFPPDERLTRVPHPPLPRPDYLVGTTDPTFGSTITRISDQQALGSSSKWLRQSYAKLQPWNSDGSRLLLGYTNPGFLLDGRSYAYTGRTLPRAPVGVWSNVDPETFYSVADNRLLQVSARTGVVRVSHTFDGWTSVTISDGQGSPSDDDTVVALIVRSAGSTAVVSYDLFHNRVLGTLALPAAKAEQLAWAAASQSGRHVLLNWQPDGSSQGQGVDTYDSRLRFERHLYDVSEPGDLGYDTTGHEVYVTLDGPSGKRSGDQLLLVSVRLDDAQVETELRLDWVGTQVSCRNLDRPGWCYVSDGAADAPESATGGFDEIYAVRLDGSGTVERFAHAHQSKGVPYDWTAAAVPSRDGTRVVWASDWGTGTSSPAYAYVASYVDPVGGAR